MKKKICVVTATRAEYGLLYWLLKEIKKDKNLELQLIVTGMHLSADFGLTYKEVEKEFKITKKIDMDLSDDSKKGICNSMGIAQTEFGKAYEELKPDLLVVLGDRYELIPIVSSAVVFNIPVVHLHGGEVTLGAIDNYFRNAITQMSSLHFCSTLEYKKNIIRMIGSKRGVYYIGAMGIENIKRVKLLSKEELERSIGFKLNKKNILVTYHPETLRLNDTTKDFQAILNSIDKLKETNIIFTYANSDTNGKVINKMIDEYVLKNSHKSISFTSMGQVRFLSALKLVDAIVGNSSSGIIEAPSLHTATINIGNRQKGRIKAKSVIDVKPNIDELSKAFEKIYTKEFQKRLKNIKNPYEKERYPSKKVVKILKRY